MSKQTKTNVAVRNENESFNALVDINALKEAMSGDETQGLDFSFDRAVVPTGGGLQFQLPGDNPDEPEMVKDLIGVILFNHPSYAYYTEKYNGAQNPPECFSIDGINGNGTPGGECRRCPYNHFGSGENNSKACKNKRMLYILIEGQLFPIMLHLPTGSLKSFTQYIKSNLSKGKKLSQVVTKISLKKATNSTGIAYSQCTFSFIRDLSSEEKEQLIPIVQLVKDYAISRPTLIQDDDIPFDNVVEAEKV